MAHITDTFNHWIGYIAILMVVVTLVISGTASYTNSLHACERGNLLRHAVYASVLNAEQTATHGKSGYAKERMLLLSIPNVDPKTGEIDCEQAVVKPFYVIR